MRLVASNRIAKCIAVVVLLASASISQAAHLDGVLMGFEGYMDYEWQRASIETYPWIIDEEDDYSQLREGQYLGQFGETAVEFLGMDFFDYGYNADQSKAYVSFDLILFGDWSGNAPGYETTFKVANGLNTLFEATFSHYGWLDQSYPGSLESGSYPAATGAHVFERVRDSNLGRTFASIYRIAFEVDTGYTEDTTILDFYLAFAADFAGETEAAWGLDNVVFSSSPIEPIPEPSTGILLGMGLSLLAVRSHRV